MIILGDSNFYRFTENRNREGGNYNAILVFNSIISHLGLIELPIKGCSFTWCNMQDAPLLEQIDWFFTSISWATKYPSMMVLPLERIIQIISLAKFTLVLQFRRRTFSDSKIIGSVTHPASRLLAIPGLLLQVPPIVHTSLVISLSSLGRF